MICHRFLSVRHEIPLLFFLFGTAAYTAQAGEADKEAAEEFNEKVVKLVQSGEFDKAIEAAHPLLNDAIETFGKNHKLVGYIELKIGECYRSAGNFEESVQHFERALPIQRKSSPPNSKNVLLLYYQMGDSYRELGNYDLAERNLGFGGA